jgi:hypothetical protein
MRRPVNFGNGVPHPRKRSQTSPFEHAALIDPFPESRDREDHYHCLDGDFDGH